MAEKANDQDLRKAVEQMKKDGTELSKQLDRTLELFKRLKAFSEPIKMYSFIENKR